MISLGLPIQLTRKSPIALRLILRPSLHGTDGLMSPPKDAGLTNVLLMELTNVNVLLN